MHGSVRGTTRYFDALSARRQQPSQVARRCSFTQPWRHPLCMPRASRRDARESKSPAAALPRRLTLAVLRSPPCCAKTLRRKAEGDQRVRTYHSDGTAEAASVYTSKSNVPAPDGLAKASHHSWQTERTRLVQQRQKRDAGGDLRQDVR